MKISVNQLKTCPINSEIYREIDVSDIVSSISEVGLLQPIVVTSDNTIISGHRRFKAIQSLGWTEVEVEVKEIFSTEENCGKRIQEIYKEAKERKTVIPPQFNIGCVPLNKVTT